VESQAEPIAAEGHGAAAYRSLDELLRYWAFKRPRALALAGPEAAPAAGSGGGARRFTFAAAEEAVNRLSAFFLSRGLRPGDIVATQLPNTVELVLVTLAAMRAGLTPSPMSLVWRKAELLQAFARAPVKAAIACGCFHGFDHADAMRRASLAHAERTGAEPTPMFTLGGDAGEWTQPLDGELFAGSDGADDAAPPQESSCPEDSLRPERFEQEHPGMLSWGFDRETGPMAILRSRRELVASGLGTAVELELAESDLLLNPYSVSSLTGLACAVAPWLITGASLVLQAPCDGEGLMGRILEQGATVAVTPAALLADMAGRMNGGSLTRVVCVLPSPHCPAPAGPPFADVSLFTARNLREFAVVVDRFVESEDGASVALGAAGSPAPGAGGVPLLETRVRSRGQREPNGAAEGQPVQSSPALSGELCVRGPSAPQKQNLPTAVRFKCDGDGFVNTGISCMVAERETGKLLICLPEPDVAYHGGVLVDVPELDRIYAEFPDFLDAAAFTIDDPVMGERIFAAVVPLPGAAPAEPEFRAYLASLELSPVKIPEKLVVVSLIPRDGQGRVLRTEILSRI
jgi:mycobactin salicyl-AMP ligase